jgi:hypothetical protein
MSEDVSRFKTEDYKKQTFNEWVKVAGNQMDILQWMNVDFNPHGRAKNYIENALRAQYLAINSAAVLGMEDSFIVLLDPWEGIREKQKWHEHEYFLDLRATNFRDALIEGCAIVDNQKNREGK